MKPSEEFFKFPIRAYDAVELEFDDYIQDMKSAPPEREVKEYVVIQKRINIDSIIGWNESFSRGRTIEDVKRYGCDATKVEVGDDTYMCDWDMKTFEREYDKHYRKLDKHYNITEEEFLEVEKEIKQRENEPTTKTKP